MAYGDRANKFRERRLKQELEKLDRWESDMKKRQKVSKHIDTAARFVGKNIGKYFFGSVGAAAGDLAGGAIGDAVYSGENIKKGDRALFNSLMAGDSFSKANKLMNQYQDLADATNWKHLTEPVKTGVSEYLSIGMEGMKADKAAGGTKWKDLKLWDKLKATDRDIKGIYKGIGMDELPDPSAADTSEEVATKTKELTDQAVVEEVKKNVAIDDTSKIEEVLGNLDNLSPEDKVHLETGIDKYNKGLQLTWDETNAMVSAGLVEESVLDDITDIDVSSLSSDELITLHKDGAEIDWVGADKNWTDSQLNYLANEVGLSAEEMVDLAPTGYERYLEGNYNLLGEKVLPDPSKYSDFGRVDVPPVEFKGDWTYDGNQMTKDAIASSQINKTNTDIWTDMITNNQVGDQRTALERSADAYFRDRDELDRALIESLDVLEGDYVNEGVPLENYSMMSDMDFEGFDQDIANQLQAWEEIEQEQMTPEYQEFLNLSPEERIQKIESNKAIVNQRVQALYDKQQELSKKVQGFRDASFERNKERMKLENSLDVSNYLKNPSNKAEALKEYDNFISKFITDYRQNNRLGNVMDDRTLRGQAAKEFKMLYPEIFKMLFTERLKP